MIQRLRSLLLLLSLALPMLHAHAGTVVGQRVQAGLRAADQDAATGRWDAALERVGKLRLFVRSATRQEMRAEAASPDSARSAALRALERWRLEQARRVRAGKADRAAVQKEYEARRQALARRRPAPSLPGDLAPGVRQQTVGARALLLYASLDDAAARYFAGRGDSRQADAARRDALRNRFQAYVTLGKREQAGAAAEKLLQLSSNDAAAYSSAGEFYMGARQWARAAEVWQRGIQMLESGKAILPAPGTAGSRQAYQNRQVTTFYRQLAYCYSRLGRKSEADQAMQRAAQAEAARRP